jgi:erythromycin esterase-like protein
MWRNVVVRDFVDWLYDHNQRNRLVGVRGAGFYGLDLYSLHRSMQEVIRYLDNVDPQAAARARMRYSCFDHTSADDGQAHGFAAAFGAGLSCEREAIEQLVEMQKTALEYARRDGMIAEDEAFYAQQNAQVVSDAESYYRSMFGGRVTSWNLRDQHMAQTLQALLRHLDRHQGPPARIVVWAHNSHVGDARATEVGGDGQITLGQLARERYGDDCRLIGFTTYSGTVTAASEWGGIAERKRVRPALNGSVEELFHETERPEFLVSPMVSRATVEPLDTVRLGRAIGVIYQPATERQSHYYHVRPGEQFDAIIHIDRTRALEPLETTSHWEAGETPDTYPTGL